MTTHGVGSGTRYYVFVTPRQFVTPRPPGPHQRTLGRTSAHWVAATKTPEETGTRTPLPDPHALAVALVTVTFPNGPGPTPAAFQPFVQPLASVAGTQSCQSIFTRIAEQNTTATVPQLTAVQLAKQVAPTFVVC